MNRFRETEHFFEMLSEISPPSKPPQAGSGWAGSRWPAAMVLTALSALVILIAGNPLEQIEREGFDQTLRARARLGWTPPADRRIAILGIDDADMAALPDLTAEYQAVATAIAQASELGAAVSVLDVIDARGSMGSARALACGGRRPRRALPQGRGSSARAPMTARALACGGRRPRRALPEGRGSSARAPMTAREGACATRHG